MHGARPTNVQHRQGPDDVLCPSLDKTLPLKSSLLHYSGACCVPRQSTIASAASKETTQCTQRPRQDSAMGFDGGKAVSIHVQVEGWRSAANRDGHPVRPCA